MTARYLTVEQWAEERQQPAWTIRKQIRVGRIRAINVGTVHRPIYRIPVGERDRYDADNAA